MFTFVSGNLALDFAGTIKARTGSFDDALGRPADLAEWFVAAELLDRAPDCDAGTLDRAVRLREAAYRMAIAVSHGEPLADADRRIVNDCAKGELPAISLRADGTITRTGTPAAALTAIARAAIELLGSSASIKECGRAECTRLYVDASRGGTRRWCDMTICGNRVKSAAFRARHTAD
ncbi:putative RNA-binding Zn ribbon-like protein [Nocardia tenerifensis]|uniref:Putative RNA-binding Zn ribbon-like protein n=1 Tax=Nocardia tenerifensis TaxID=228006 RepID=A0A318K7X9_9NOCA|nr:CGNR zinc finger domain-containing protein [Nocardia tenerifensis]PXX65556.1 putative RNA-binding Zn ribbon-like protein [Nocardia tenerifensis]